MLSTLMLSLDDITTGQQMGGELLPLTLVSFVVSPKTKKKSNSLPDVGILHAFYNVIVHVVVLTAVFLANCGHHPSSVLQPRDVLEDVVEDFINQYVVAYIHQKLSTNEIVSNIKKKKWLYIIESKHQNLSDVMGTVPCQD